MANEPKKLQVLGKFGSEAGVKTVNGIEPDENGNVEITLPETSEQVQANLEQNDETQPDYVKGRTHWVDGIVETVVLEETTVEIDDSLYAEISTLVLVEGQNYIVSWNNIRYECTVWSGEYGGVYLGDGNILGYGGDGEDVPFCFEPDYINVNEAGTYTFSITRRDIEVHKLPMMYLPYGYPYVSDPVETILLEETSVEIVETGESVQISDSLIFEVGATYIVTFNGVQYECVAWAADSDVFVIGGNDEPFECASYSNGGCEVSVGEAGIYIISISGMLSKIHKIDERYLPDGATIGVAGTGRDAEVFNGGDPENASGSRAHAEGFLTEASGDCSHSEGSDTTASGGCSHSEGSNTTASGDCSHSEGEYTIAASEYQHVQGKNNIEDTANKYAHIVGNGKAVLKRSNAHTLDWNGLGWFAGGLKVGGTGQDDEAAQEVALKSDVATMIQEALSEFTNVAEVGA